MFRYDGRGERTRTSGLAVPNRALYQAELRPAGHRRHVVGRSERNRTSDLPDPNRTRYHAALRSEMPRGRRPAGTCSSAFQRMALEPFLQALGQILAALLALGRHEVQVDIHHHIGDEIDGADDR